MANLISKADGNLTAANGWNAVETGTGAVQQTRSASTTTTTSYVYSSAFTGTNTKVCDGLLLYCNRSTTTGTIDVALSDDNGTTATRSVTVNATDLPADPSWVFFKFGSTLTLDGGVDYKVGVKGSSAGNATFFRDATAGNWTHILRLTDTATAAAGDVMYIVGEHTGAGTTTARTITMDSTATTDYGTGTDGAADNGIEIGDSGSLTYGTTAATNYYLKLSGTLNVWGNGTLNVGTTGTPIPRTSTAVLEFDPVADGGMGLIANPGAIVNIQGLSRTVSKNIVACKLNTDEAINSTDLGVDTDTGWLDNDQIVVASTTRTATQTELGALNGNAGASSLTVDGFGGVGGGLANAHSGTSPTQAEVINITRNVKVRSATSTLMAYVYAQTTSTVDIDWAEFYYLGENASNKRGIEIATTTGSFNMQFSSVHDCEDWGTYITGSSTNNITYSSNVHYNLDNAAVASTRTFNIDTTSGTSITLDSNYWLGCSCASNDAVLQLSDVGFTFTNNTIAGSGNGSSSNAINFNEGNAFGTFNGITSHSNAGRGVNQAAGTAYTTPTGSIQNITAWRNTSTGLQLSGGSYGVTFDTATLFGNGSPNIAPSGGGLNYYLKNFTVNSDSSFTVGNGIFVQGNGVVHVYNSTFGVTTAHTSQDISSQNNGAYKVYFYNCTLASSTQSNIQTGGSNAQSAHYLHRNGQTTSHKSYFSWGSIASDTTTRHTASGFSWKMTPNNASQKLILPGPTKGDTFKVPINASTQVTIKVWVQKDGSYNGNAPRLVLVGAATQGIASDVIATLSVGASTWEQLTVSGTPTETGAVEFYIDCDGTAGNVYVDDVTVTQP